MNVLRLSIYLLLIVVVPACKTTSDSQVSDYSAVSDCDSLLHPQDKNAERHEIDAAGAVTETLGTAASATLTTIGYTGDVAIVLVGKVGVGVVLCAPIFVVEAAARSQGTASGQCVGSIVGSMDWATTFGKTIFQSTDHWRNHALSDVARRLRHSALCHESKGSRTSLDTAMRYLEVVLARNGMRDHVDSNEILESDAAYKRISGKVFEMDQRIAAEQRPKTASSDVAAAKEPVKDLGAFKPSPSYFAEANASDNRWMLSSQGRSSVWILRSGSTESAKTALERCETFSDDFGTSWSLATRDEVMDALRSGLDSKDRNFAFASDLNQENSFVWIRDFAGPVKVLLIQGAVKAPSFYKNIPDNQPARPLCVIRK